VLHCCVSRFKRDRWKNDHCLLWLSGTSHLDQKYEQEVEVCDSSELLKQILGNEVPGGILWDKATAGLKNVKTERETRYHPDPLARETSTCTGSMSTRKNETLSSVKRN